MITIKMNLQYKIACIRVTGGNAIIGGVVAKELMTIMILFRVYIKSTSSIEYQLYSQVLPVYLVPI